MNRVTIRQLITVDDILSVYQVYYNNSVLIDNDLFLKTLLKESNIPYSIERAKFLLECYMKKSIKLNSHHNNNKFKELFRFFIDYYLESCFILKDKSNSIYFVNNRHLYVVENNKLRYKIFHSKRKNKSISSSSFEDMLLGFKYLYPIHGLIVFCKTKGLEYESII